VQYARSPITSCVAWSTSTPWSASTDLAPETGSSLAALQIGAVTEREITRALIALNRTGLAESSVKRFRASLSSFFAWAVRERLIAANPVTGTRVPVGRGARAAIRPFAEDELESFYLAVSAHDQQLAEVLLIASWTGLRWSELREVRVRDFVRVPMPVLLVSRAAPEGIEAKITKSGKSRRMPVADRVLSLVEACAHGKGPDDLLFTTKTGHRLHASALKRTVHWSTVAPGRRIHNLRHTAACLWLAKGVDPVTVQAWLGHASIATTNIYLHHLGSFADRAGLDRLNALGARGVRTRRIERNDRCETPHRLRCLRRWGGVCRVVELRGLEPLTFSLRTRRATNCAAAPQHRPNRREEKRYHPVRSATNRLPAGTQVPTAR
jgi:integrase